MIPCPLQECKEKFRGHGEPGPRFPFFGAGRGTSQRKPGENPKEVLPKRKKKWYSNLVSLWADAPGDRREGRRTDEKLKTVPGGAFRGAESRRDAFRLLAESRGLAGGSLRPAPAAGGVRRAEQLHPPAHRGRCRVRRPHGGHQSAAPAAGGSGRRRAGGGPGLSPPGQRRAGAEDLYL